MHYVYGVYGLQFKTGIAAPQPRRKVMNSEVRPGNGKHPATQAVKRYENIMRKMGTADLTMPVSRVMSSPVLTVTRYQSLYTAWRLLKEENIRQLVVTSERNEVIGILAEREILQHITVKDGVVDADRILPVADVLQQEVFATESTSDIRQIAGMMADHHIEAMAIIDKKRAALGIVTRGDILRCFAANSKVNLWI